MPVSCSNLFNLLFPEFCLSHRYIGFQNRWFLSWGPGAFITFRWFTCRIWFRVKWIRVGVGCRLFLAGVRRVSKVRIVLVFLLIWMGINVVVILLAINFVVIWMVIIEVDVSRVIGWGTDITVWVLNYYCLGFKFIVLVFTAIKSIAKVTG